MKSVLLLINIITISTSFALEITTGNPVEVDFVEPKKVVLLEFNTQADKIYQLQYSSDLSTWFDYGNSFKGSGNFTSKIVSSMGAAKVFYRLIDSGKAENLPSLLEPQREWTDVLSSRFPSTVYTNNENHEIIVVIRISSNAAIIAQRPSDNTTFVVGYATQSGDTITAAIPAGWGYVVSTSGPLNVWNELR